MRKITIMRPKRMEAGAMKLQVFADGNKAGDLANGKEVVLNVDENAHEIDAHGGMFAGKGFGFKFHIPAGNYSYCFQTDMINAKNGYVPILRPTDGQRLKDDVKVRSLIGTEATQVLLKEETRNLLASGGLAQVNMLDDKWQINVVKEGQSQTVYEQGYSSTQVVGVILGGIASVLDKMSYDTPEHKEETLNQLFTAYFNYLPDYEIVDGRSLKFKG